MFDDLARRNAKKLSLEEKAEYGCLPAELTLDEIVRLLFGLSPESRWKNVVLYRKNHKFSGFFKNDVIEAIKRGELQADQRYPADYMPGLHKVPVDALFSSERFHFAIGPDTTYVCVRDEWFDVWPEEREKYRNHPVITYLIHKNHFKAWLQKVGEWPVDGNCLLSGWWSDEGMEVQAPIPASDGVPLQQTDSSASVGAIPERREAVLTEWVKEQESRGNGFNRWCIGPTRAKVWEELGRLNSELFGPLSPSTIEQFFKKQKVCGFKTGRK